jgi:hypothetical protein
MSTNHPEAGHFHCSVCGQQNVSNDRKQTHLFGTSGKKGCVGNEVRKRRKIIIDDNTAAQHHGCLASKYRGICNYEYLLYNSIWEYLVDSKEIKRDNRAYCSFLNENEPVNYNEIK